MKFKGLNDNKVTVQLGLSVGTLGKSRKEGRDLSDRVVGQILNFYSDLNKVWLLTGNGEMLIRPASQVIQSGANSINNSGIIENSTIDNRHYYSDSPDVLRSEIDKLDRIIAEKEERIKEKDAQIKEKDAQIKTLLEILKNN